MRNARASFVPCGPVRQATLLVTAVAVIVSGLLALHATPAVADKRADKKAKKLQQAGDKYLRRGERRVKQGKGKRAKKYYEKALAKYQKAYKLAPKASIAIAIADAEARLERYAEAMALYQKILADAQDDAIKSEVTKRIQELKGNVAAVTFAIQPNDAELTINGELRGTAPIAGAVFLAPGKHTVTVSQKGYTPHETALDLTAGQETTQTIELKPAATAAAAAPSPASVESAPKPAVSTKTPPPTAEPESKAKAKAKPGARARTRSGPEPRPEVDTERLPTLEESRRSRRTARRFVRKPGKGRLILGGILTVGLIGGATFSGISAVREQDTFKDQSQPQGVRDEAKDSGQTLALVTDILIAGAVVVGAYSAYHYLFSYRPQAKDYEEQERRRNNPRLLISPYYDGRGAGLAVHGRF